MPKFPRFAKAFTSVVILLSLPGALVGRVSPAAAQQAPKPSEPIAVIRSASYDRWYENVALIGRLSGSPDLAQGLEAMLKIATANRGLAGLDKKRPFVAVVIPHGAIFNAYVCLPVDNLESLLDVVRPLAKSILRNGDVHEIVLQSGATLYVVSRAGWAIVAVDTDTIRRAVEDPRRLLDDLPKQHDLVVRLYVSRISKLLREVLFAQIRQAVGGDPRRPLESHSDHPIRRRFDSLVLQAVKTGLDELDQVTVGLTVDHAARRMSVELLLVAKEGTPTARRWSQYEQRESHLSGFRLPEAAVTATWAGTLPKATSDMLLAMVDTMKQEAFQDIERSSRAEWVNLEKQITAGFLAIAQSLSADGHLEGTACVVLQPDATALIAAMRLPAAGQWPERIEHLASLIRRYPDMRTGVQRATDRGGEVRLHRLSNHTACNAVDREALVRLFGEEIELVMGAGEEHLYVALGRDGLELLRTAIAASRTADAAPAAPFECSIALGPVAELIAALAQGHDKASAIRIVQELKQSPGKDHVHCTAGPIEKGFRIRVELEEGVLRTAGLTLGMLGVRPEAAASGGDGRARISHHGGHGGHGDY